MEKISVKVCLGTTCFVMGGNNLQELNDIIPKNMVTKLKYLEVHALACAQLTGSIQEHHM